METRFEDDTDLSLAELLMFLKRDIYADYKFSQVEFMYRIEGLYNFNTLSVIIGASGDQNVRMKAFEQLIKVSGEKNDASHIVSVVESLTLGDEPLYELAGLRCHNKPKVMKALLSNRFVPGKTWLCHAGKVSSDELERRLSNVTAHDVEMTIKNARIGNAGFRALARSAKTNDDVLLAICEFGGKERTDVYCDIVRRDGLSQELRAALPTALVRAKHGDGAVYRSAVNSLRDLMFMIGSAGDDDVVSALARVWEHEHVRELLKLAFDTDKFRVFVDAAIPEGVDLPQEWKMKLFVAHVDERAGLSY